MFGFCLFKSNGLKITINFFRATRFNYAIKHVSLFVIRYSLGRRKAKISVNFQKRLNIDFDIGKR